MTAVSKSASARDSREDYGQAVARLHRELGIPADYAERFKLTLCEEASELVSIGTDVSGREQRLAPRAADAWRGMHGAAAQDGIELLVVSGFRSVDYQRALIQRKLDKGRSIAEVLKINAAPGYSEHHTGRALDLTAPDCPPLEQGFETTRAFAWLTRHAAQYGFRLSYPRDNPHGITYEPWHWAFHDQNRTIQKA
jgi:D-alanyl-D-alanine carboxypeptidase